MTETGCPLFDDPLSLYPNPILEWARFQMMSSRRKAALGELLRVDIEEAFQHEASYD